MWTPHLKECVLVALSEGGEAAEVVSDPGDPLHREPVARDGRRGAHRDPEHAVHSKVTRMLLLKCEKEFKNICLCDFLLLYERHSV